VSHRDDDLWSFVMLPDSQPGSVVFLFLLIPCVVCLLVLTAAHSRLS
jgi:hypothetical protein